MIVSTIELGNAARISLSSYPSMKAPTPNAPMKPRIPMLIGKKVAMTNIATSAIRGSTSTEVMMCSQFPVKVAHSSELPCRQAKTTSCSMSHAPLMIT